MWLTDKWATQCFTKFSRAISSCYENLIFIHAFAIFSCRYEQQPETLRRTEEQAAALARLQSLQALYAAWPDAERIARKEDCTVNDGRLNYTVTYTVVADICG